ncbi:hypothetical protein OG379_27850 [Streptomyces sp. NBC_01166]|uniref:hypothetical protein n=1 Tax=Streptomyces sp. NBC_01166 TaxID=2903755 RepID=UPI0038709F86|nr:hypothetical protein OG379_27850 [Streptomyces sp. NBC_01166]
MTSHVLVAAELAGRWQGPPWFKWAFLAVWVLFAVFLLVRLRRNGWKLPRRR